MPPVQWVFFLKWSLFFFVCPSRRLYLLHNQWDILGGHFLVGTDISAFLSPFIYLIAKAHRQDQTKRRKNPPQVELPHQNSLLSKFGADFTAFKQAEYISLPSNKGNRLHCLQTGIMYFTIFKQAKKDSLPSNKMNRLYYLETSWTGFTAFKKQNIFHYLQTSWTGFTTLKQAKQASLSSNKQNIFHYLQTSETGFTAFKQAKQASLPSKSRIYFTTFKQAEQASLR